MEAFIRDNELPTKILGRCPTCLYNFKRIFCDMMCSPNQSEFLNASQTVLAPNSNKEMVKVLDYHVSHEYADKALWAILNQKTEKKNIYLFFHF